MQSIKISSTDKGEFHWESYLLKKQSIRLNKLLTQLGINPWKKRNINKLFKNKVTKENIIPLSSHPIRIFLVALINNNLDELTNSSTIINH